MLTSLKQSVKISDLVKKKKPLIMGILNVTPDSFSDGGKYFKLEDALKHTIELIKQGADIIDIGGESTRPGATLITEEEELKQVIPVICELCKITEKVSANRRTGKSAKKISISIDTCKANVARAALEAGVDMINDVSGLTKDLDMVKVAAKYNCPIVIMHNRGIPATKPESENRRIRESSKKLIGEVYTWLQKQTNYAIKTGIKQENIIIDLGIGFGKTPEEDLALIKNLQEFKSLGFPILVGPSRKSFIRKLFGDEDFENKNTEIIKLIIKNGVDILRVH